MELKKKNTNGYDLEIIQGVKEILKESKFVITAVRHKYESFKNCYKLHQFMNVMQENEFQLSIIFTANPFIAYLFFQAIKDLNNFNINLRYYFAR